VLGIQHADHEETNPDSSIRLISKLSCSLVGEKQIIQITPGTLIFQSYGEKKVIERFHCNYGLNEEYRDEISTGELKIVGIDTNGEARIAELPNHRFFIATLFLPQLSSSPEVPHPLISAYMKAALAFRVIKQKGEIKM
jgi:CTP synthase (UTP-ammonia lyase)